MPLIAPTRATGVRVSVSSSAMTQVGSAIGTPLYMAPEQAAGHADVDGRADQYALACVLFEMLVGRPPYTAPTLRELVARHAKESIPVLARERDGVPEPVTRAIEKALAKRPEDRFETMARFAEALAVTTLTATTSVVPEPEAAKVPNNLRKQRTHFIGRENELAECLRLMGETRMLTLTGIGGCGKTRIGIRLAETLLASYPDGVWVVDLAPLQDPDRVPLTTAITLGLREEPGTPILDSLARHLATQRAIIVLDNCEHVIEATAAMVDELLATSSELKLIVTSREGLGVAGERVYAVRSLKVPAATETQDLRAIEASESVRLFVDRARQVVPDFALTPESTLVVAEICRRLDGIPLAIEFAAARVELLSVEQIRAKLDDRFRLLTGGSRALPRHQTLQATIQWSYDHLGEDEQHLFRMLAVFAGGWTLAGASAVEQEGADEFEVLDLLGNLVRKSLIYVRRDGPQEPRYHMLETVRQYAQMRLDESGEADAARTRHLDFYLRFVDEVGVKLVGPEQGECLRRLDLDLDNLLAAHDWCNRATDGANKGLRLLKELPLYWGDRGMLDLGLKLFREALARPDADLPLRARMLAAAGSLAFRQGLYDDAHALAEESLAIARECGDLERQQFALHLLGATVHSRGDLDGAANIYEEGLALARRANVPRALADLLNALAMVRHGQDRLDDAAGLYLESLVLKRQLGNLRDVGIVSLNLAQLELQRGGLEKARASVLEGLVFVGETRSKVGARTLLDTAAGVAAAEHHWARAARLFGAADGVLAWAIAPRDPGDERVMVPMIELTRAALGADAFDSAYASGQALGFEEGLAELRRWLAGEPTQVGLGQ